MVDEVEGFGHLESQAFAASRFDSIGIAIVAIMSAGVL